MSNSEPSPDLLIAKYLDQTLSADEAGTLLTLLKEKDEVRALLQRNLWCDFYLRERALSSPEPVTESKPVEVERTPTWDELVALQNAERPISVMVEEYRAKRAAERAHRHPIRLAARFAKKCVWPSKRDFEESIAPVVTIFLVFCALLATTIFFVERALRPIPEEPITTMARVNETIDAVWEQDADEYRRGQLVDSSSFRLKSGLVQLQMNNGTTLILEGPAELTISDAMKSFCHKGKVSVSVPKAGHGYELATPFGSVVDRGTEFYVDVAKKESLVQTLKGKIEFLSTTKKLFPLFENQSLHFDLSNRVKSVATTVNSDYIASPVFYEKVDQRVQMAITEKEIAQEAQAEDPSLLLQLDLNEKKAGKIRNRSQVNNLCFARWLGGKRVSGSLYKTSAWKFDDRNDGITVNLGGPYSSMTFEALVRYEPAEKSAQVLMSSTNLLEEQGALLWQITQEGCLQVQFASRSGETPDCYTSIPCLGLRERGVWVHLRLVLDSEKHQIMQYVDGRRIPQQIAGQTSVEWRNQAQVKPNEITIGNYRGRLGSDNNRSLAMPLAEFNVWSKAVYEATDQE
ncbi:MAG: FecR domain-containing protein [Planctomycetia bacterium]|nr:FecR domain-containing protein [Planctomycetia bacterium]